MTVSTQPFPAPSLSEVFGGATSPIQSVFNTPTLDPLRSGGNIQKGSKSISPGTVSGFSTALPVAADSGTETAPTGERVQAGIPGNLVIVAAVAFLALALVR